MISRIKFCKSLHHHTIPINQSTRWNNFSCSYLTFMYSSTYFGRPHAQHQELNNCSSSLWFYRWSVVVAVLLVVVGPVITGPTTTNSTPETCWAVHKRQVRTWEIVASSCLIYWNLFHYYYYYYYYCYWCLLSQAFSAW